MASRKANVTLTIKEIHHNPGQTIYTVNIEIPNGTSEVAYVTRDDQDKLSLHKDSDCRPALASLAMKEVKEHIIAVRLD